MKIAALSLNSLIWDARKLRLAGKRSENSPAEASGA